MVISMTWLAGWDDQAAGRGIAEVAAVREEEPTAGTDSGSGSARSAIGPRAAPGPCSIRYLVVAARPRQANGQQAQRTKTDPSSKIARHLHVPSSRRTLAVSDLLNGARSVGAPSNVSWCIMKPPTGTSEPAVVRPQRGDPRAHCLHTRGVDHFTRDRWHLRARNPAGHAQHERARGRVAGVDAQAPAIGEVGGRLTDGA